MFFAYLAQYEFIPQIEYLIKLGFINLAKEFLKGRVSAPRSPASPLFNINENNIIKFLGCRDKNYFKKLPQKVSAEDLRYSDRVKQKFNVEIFSPQYATYKTFLKNNFDLIKELEEYASFKTILNYYETQKKKEKSFSNFMMDYRDYLCAAVALKLNLADTAILKPYNFREMHDRTCDTWTNLKNKEKNKPFKEALKKYKLNFEDETYKIIVPANISDIVAEGRNNNNCVGNYVDRVIGCRSIIVFVRDKKELKKSLVTVEISPASFKIVQTRARSNKEPPVEIANFLNTYSQKVLVKEYGRLQKASVKLARELHCKNENILLEA